MRLQSLSVILLAASAAAGAVSACGSDVSESSDGSGGSGGSSSSATATATTTASGMGTAGTGGCDGSGGGAGFTGQPEWTSCDGPGQCSIRRATCCDTCGPQTLESAVAIRNDSIEPVTKAICEYECNSQLNCPDIDCAPVTEHVTAVCRTGSCEAVDVRKDELSACATDADCTLRWGVTCCELCVAFFDNAGLVAVRKTPSFSGELCDPNIGCPPCAPPPYPAEATAICNASGHCEVKFMN